MQKVNKETQLVTAPLLQKVNKKPRVTDPLLQKVKKEAPRVTHRLLQKVNKETRNVTDKTDILIVINRLLNRLNKGNKTMKRHVVATC